MMMQFIQAEETGTEFEDTFELHQAIIFALLALAKLIN